ncbi:MAG TPA: histidine kinase, partial [Nonomuraea sp.]|nr:histidine kinase [Nonomuraea sp.]
MSGAGRQGDPAPRLAWMFAAAFLCLVLPARAAIAVYGAGPAGLVAVLALFVLPLSYTVPPGRAMWARWRVPLLVVQAVLTYAPFLVFGQEWVVGLSGLLGGLLLLTVRGPASWVLFCAVLLLEGVLRVGDSLSLAAWAVTAPVNLALALFGLVRLADLVTDLHATRAELVTTAVASQRLRAAGLLRAAIGDRLEAVTAHAEAALPMLGRSPGQARDRLVEAAAVARQALEQVRVAVTRDGHPHGGTTGAAGDLTEHRAGDRAGHGAGDTVAPRVARLVLVVVLCAFSAQVLVNVLGSGAAAPVKAGAAAVIVAIVALQFRHTPARRDGVRPRGWAWTLAAQTLLSVVPVWVFDEVNLLGMAGFAAGSALLLLPARWAWAAFSAIVLGAGTMMAAYSAYGLYDAVYAATGTAAYGLVVYGLSRLTDLAHRVEAARRELARTAAVRERTRVARDTHDLLGLGLSAVALKCDLVVRLIGRDDTRAENELRQLLEVAAKARDEVLSVTGQGRERLSLRHELAAARDVLTAAGVAVHADVGAVPLPSPVDEVLGTVLREAVTNVLRHAAAERCVIALSTAGGAARLRVTNDGVRSSGSAGR